MTSFSRQTQQLITSKFLGITEPAKSITDNYKRQQIRLLNSIALVFVPIAILAGLSHILLAPSDEPILQDSAFLVILLSTVLLSVAAFFGRYIGYWGATGLVFSTGYFIILFNVQMDKPDFFDATYIILLSVLGAALFNIKIVSLIATVEIISVNLILESSSMVNTVNMSIFLIVSNLIIMFTMYYRASVEKERRQKLVESEAFLRLITEQMPVSVWITDKNLSRRATFGRTPQIEKLATIPSNLSIDAYYQALAGNSVQFEDKHDERYFQFRIEPMRDADNDIIGTLGVATDISEQKIAQDRELQLQLEREHVVILSKFIEHSSHDLRTPISNINTYLYLLKNSVTTDKERNYIQVIREQSERLQGLINNMLMLQRLELETVQAVDTFSLNSLLDSLETAYRDRIQNEQIKFTYDPPTDQLTLNGVEKNIYLAISKVMDNALQFTPPNGHIQLYTTLNNDEVVISIQDTGIGIPEDQLPQIFEVFYRGDESRPTTNGDNGLGLTIVNTIVKSHRGNITVDSVLHEGTTVHITLPVVKVKQMA